MKGTCTLGIITAGLLFGCATPNLYPHLRADRTVLRREWTLLTQPNAIGTPNSVEYSNIIEKDGVLVFGSQSVGVVALYPNLGQVRWVLPISGGVISRLTLEGDRVYFVGADGFLYATDVETGTVDWRSELRAPIASRPVVYGGKVLVTTAGNRVQAFELDSGKWLWHYRRQTGGESSILGAAAPTVVGSDVLAGLSDGYLVALDLENGKLKWERRLSKATKFTDIDADPVLDNGRIYVSSYDGSLSAFKVGGNYPLQWRFDAGASRAVHIEGDKLYLSSSDGSVYCLQKEGGRQLWKFTLDGGVPTEVVLSEGRVIVGSSQQYLYVLDQKTGKPLYRMDAGVHSGFHSTPYFSDSRKQIYFLSSVGNLYAFHILPNKDKRFRWSDNVDQKYFYKFL